MAMSQDSFKLKVVGGDGHRHTLVDTHKDVSKENMFNALSKLDRDGDGAFRMEDLLGVLEDQPKRLKTWRSQRSGVVVYAGMTLLLFAQDVSSSVLNQAFLKKRSA